MNHRTSSPAQRQALGKRLKQAAYEARYRSGSIGEKLGCEDGTVRGWWNGRSEPSVATLIQYAELTGRSLEWLMTGAENDQPDTPETRVQRFDRLRKQGVDPETALDIVTGGSRSGEAEEARLTEGEREFLQRTSADLLWENLTPEQQARFLRRLRGEAEPEPE